MGPYDQGMTPAPRTRYSADLDPGGFTDPEEAAHRATRAISAMKLGLLLEGQVPVLSQNQVFDSPLFLAWAGADDDETSALARLIRGNWIQVRIHGSEPGDSEPRLAAAAARALADERFLLSGWPGISREEREEAAAILSGRSHLPPSGTFAPQIRGVQLLDDALRASSATERAVVVDESLAAFVRAEMDQRAGDHGRGRYLARPFAALMALADRMADGEVFELDGEPLTGLDLNRRSDRRRLLRLLAAQPESGLHAEHGALRSLSALVDLAYNTKVARSCAAQRQREVAVDETVREVVAEDPDTVGMAAEVTWFTERSAERWLTWGHVWDLLAQGVAGRPGAPGAPHTAAGVDELLRLDLARSTGMGGFAIRVLLPAAPVFVGVVGAEALGNVLFADPTWMDGALGGTLGVLLPSAVARLGVGRSLTSRVQDHRLNRARAAMAADLRTHASPRP